MHSEGTSDKLALVLSGGGARAAYQVGVLCAIAEKYPALRIPILTGVSAGAINTSFLAAHTGDLRSAAEALHTNWQGLTSDHVYCFSYSRILPAIFRAAVDFIRGRTSGRPATRGLLDMSPLGVFLEGCVDLSGIDKNIESGKLIAAALSATSYSDRSTVTFVHGASGVQMWSRTRRYSVKTKLTHDHVLASAAIPLVFEAMRVDGAYYGDGSVRQTAPLAPAIHLGAEKILAISMRTRGDATAPALANIDYPSAAELMGLMFGSVFLDALDTDGERLDRINDLLHAIPEARRSQMALRPIRLLMLNPSKDLGAMARGIQVRASAQVTWALRAIGGRRAGASDFLSYLLFDPPYTSPLMDLGYEDARAQEDRIADFIENRS